MMKLIVFLFIGSAFGNIVRRDVQDSTWDELIDQGIDAAREDIISKHFDVLTLSNINKEIHQSVLGIPFTFAVKIIGAKFYNTSTVNRRGPVTVLQDDDTGNITISTSLGLDVLNLEIENYNLHALGINLGGSLSAQCNSNTIEFSLSLIQKDEGTCIAHINSARITALGDFNIEMKPSGIMNWIWEHCIKFGLNIFSSLIRSYVNKNLAIQLNAAIGNIDICSYIPI